MKGIKGMLVTGTMAAVMAIGAFVPAVTAGAETVEPTEVMASGYGTTYYEGDEYGKIELYYNEEVYAFGVAVSDGHFVAGTYTYNEECKEMCYYLENEFDQTVERVALTEYTITLTEAVCGFSYDATVTVGGNAYRITYQTNGHFWWDGECFMCGAKCDHNGATTGICEICDKDLDYVPPQTVIERTTLIGTFIRNVFSLISASFTALTILLMKISNIFSW